MPRRREISSLNGISSLDGVASNPAAAQIVPQGIGGGVGGSGGGRQSARHGRQGEGAV